MVRATLLLAIVGAVSAFQAPVIAPRPHSKLAVSRVAASPVAQEGTKSTVIGAACVGGFLGVYLFHEISWAAFLAIALAYGATTASGFGNTSRTAGDFAAKAYSKTLELNDQYDLVPKAKSALDVATTAANNIDQNYGITSGIDKQLKLSEAASKVTDKFEDLKGSVAGLTENK